MVQGLLLTLLVVLAEKATEAHDAPDEVLDNEARTTSVLDGQLEVRNLTFTEKI